MLKGQLEPLPDQIGIAVSGGGDSMALLAAAKQWADQNSARVIAATVDHGLRPEAAGEAATVAAYCDNEGIAHETLPIALAPGAGLQARARAARYDALRGWGARHRCFLILLGHTQDDVAETLLMRLGRGTGIAGLGTMPAWWHDEQGHIWGRPFLTVSRAELRTCLTARGITWIDDPSNDDPRFERVRVRQQIAALGLDGAALARSARAMDDANRTLDRHTSRLAEQVLRFEGGDVILTRAALHDLQGFGYEQLRRMTAAILNWIGGQTPRGEEVLRLWQGLGEGTAKATLAGCLITQDTRVDGVLRFAREPAACGPPVPMGAIWDGRWRVTPPVTWPENSSEFSVTALEADVPGNWRDTGLPKDSLRASPAVRDGQGGVIAAPLAGIGAGWQARTVPDFQASLLR